MTKPKYRRKMESLEMSRNLSESLGEHLTSRVGCFPGQYNQTLAVPETFHKMTLFHEVCLKWPKYRKSQTDPQSVWNASVDIRNQFLYTFLTNLTLVSAEIYNTEEMDNLKTLKMHYFVILLQRELNYFRQQTAFYSLEYDLRMSQSRVM